MTSEQRKELQTHLDELLGYGLEKNGAHEMICEVRPDTLHTWLLLSILDRLESIDESLVMLMQPKEQRRDGK